MLLGETLEVLVHMENVIDKLADHEARTVRSLRAPANENVAIACEACGILPVVYDFNDGGYTFAREEVNHAPIAICYEFSMGAVGDAIREVLQTRIDYKKRFEDESAKSAQEER